MYQTNLDQLISRMAKEVARSPQQVGVFKQAAEAMLKLVEEAGLEGTILPKVREEIRHLYSAIGEATRVHRQIAEEVAKLGDPAILDERGRQVVALTNALLHLYTTALTTKVGESGRVSPEPSTKTQIARAVSYTVWAYLNPGVAMPENVETPNE